jgi:acyl-CoA synthetase (AMP-forming)/AMP-acid ligase II
MNLMFPFDRAADLWPDREAVVQGDRVRMTYRELHARISGLARGLSARGIEPSRVVAVIAPNVHEFLEAYAACAALGAVVAPVNHRLSAGEIARIIDHCEAAVCLVHTELGQLAAEALRAAQRGSVRRVVLIGEPPSGLSVPCPLEDYDDVLDDPSPDPPHRLELTADTLAHLYYTSGTTGAPKGVMLTHGNVAFHALAAIAELHLTDADSWLHAAPLFHLADAWAAFAITWVGGRHVFLPTFDAGEALRTIERDRVTITNLIPTMLNLMVNHPAIDRRDFSSLRAVMSGGAPIAPEIVRRILDRFGCDYVQTYGMTETSPFLTVGLLKAHMRDLPPERQLAWKCRTGRPFVGVELRVVREDGREVARDDREVGEIEARGPTVTPGYWRDPQATAEAFRDGWLRSGDLAVVDSEGYINIVDRKKDTIITGGENVYSTEVELVLYEHPGVLEAAVVGVPDPVWGEAVTAVVVPREGHQPEEREIIEHVRSRIAHYKAPRRVVFAPELPRTGSGKISKKALRERLAGG